MVEELVEYPLVTDEGDKWRVKLDASHQGMLFNTKQECDDYVDCYFESLEYNEP